MVETALQYGFVKDHLGCPCVGRPQIMVLKKPTGEVYNLTVWEKRNVWRLTTSGYTIATGNRDTLTKKLHEYGIF